ncbi:hypothetical protein F2P81_021428 [Scophthalmus maximus]|uniref:Uncharacterized protein n=1 Tax=Scophthalmus maximus TaxID=52904 RepID=A0A6A4S6D5_SCOMX|nr:hypothetical protein F2P81_021428 [Scophthalmus maximus]
MSTQQQQQQQPPTTRSIAKMPSSGQNMLHRRCCRRQRNFFSADPSVSLNTVTSEEEGSTWKMFVTKTDRLFRWTQTGAVKRGPADFNRLKTGPDGIQTVQFSTMDSGTLVHYSEKGASFKIVNVAQNLLLNHKNTALHGACSIGLLEKCGTCKTNIHQQ